MKLAEVVQSNAIRTLACLWSETCEGEHIFFSYLQVICDARFKILDVVARWPGAVHDARIFRNSMARQMYETGELLTVYSPKQYKNYIHLKDLFSPTSDMMHGGVDHTL